jgi:sigma-B regulation protein RsbU (phosphoserine phosphatase)
MLCVIGVLLVPVCVLARAQQHTGSIPEGLVWLTSGWRYQAGDNIAWAAPAFDDANWENHWPQQQTDSCVRGCWYRLHIELPGNRDTQLALLLIGQSGVFETYIDGQRAGQAHFEPWRQVREPVGFVLPLPRGGRSVLLAIRVRPPRVAFDAKEAAFVRAAVGGQQSIEDASEFHHLRQVTRFLPSGAINVTIVFAGIALLLIFALQQRQREYLWLGLYLIILGSSSGIYTASIYAIVPGDANEIYADPAIYLGMLAETEFTFAFIGRKPNQLWRVYEAFLLIGPVLSILCSMGLIANAFYFAFESAALVPAALAIPILLFFWYRRGNAEARWLILPSLAPAAGMAVTNIPQFGELLGWNLDFLSRPVLLWGAAPLFPIDIANAVFLLAIGGVMLNRFTTLDREKARVSLELAAAREMQRQLVPASPPEMRDCRLEAAYFPAAEVGGDFYHVLPKRDGSSLLILGDVSGKGLKAAMTGALAIGSFRALASEALSPAQLLTRLNESLYRAGDGGFITCLCGQLWPGGRVVLANVGHLSPYRNGEEVQLESGLPLGIIDGLEYTETIISFERSDTLVMLTDGVVEAQSSSGELFGFERTRNISVQPAAKIAAAAQAFGQTDDISVLCITFPSGEELRSKFWAFDLSANRVAPPFCD